MSKLSLNKKIILEFQQLVSFIQNKIDNTTDEKLKTIDIFRLKQIKRVLSILKKYPKIITKNNINEFSKLQGIGKGTIDRINEILDNGYLIELKDFNEYTKLKENIIENLESIIGVGRKKALEFYNKGIKSVEDLKNKILNKKIKVNDKILLGIKYYGKFLENIPRKEIEQIHKLIKNIIDEFDNKTLFEICGSYRRRKPFSNDIDILISNKNNKNNLEKFVELFKKPIKKNNNKPLIVDDLTDKYKTKYMGFIQYKNFPFRRIDIRYLPLESFYTGLLYFTGSAEFNQNIRKIAKQKGYKLSEYGLFKNNNKININSELDIFNILNIDYVPPHQR